MTKQKRRAAGVAVPTDRTQANTFLHRLGSVTRDLAIIRQAKEESAAEAARAAAAAAAPLEALANDLMQGLQIYAEANRAALTDNGRTKTVQFPSGVLAWRTSPPSVRLTKIEQVLEALRSLQLFQFIRTKHEVNKEAMLGAATLAGTVPGVTIVSDEEQFVVEPVVETGGAP